MHTHIYFPFQADMDVEAFEGGVLASIITGEGETANVGAPVALLAANAADVPALQTYGQALKVRACCCECVPVCVCVSSLCVCLCVYLFVC